MQSFKWYFIATFVAVFSVMLSLRFEIIGLILASIMTLLMCYFCPDSFLFRKAPDRVSSTSGKAFYTTAFTLNVLILLAFVILPLTSVMALQSKQNIANFISNWESLDIINQNVKLSTAHITGNTEILKSAKASTLSKLNIMQDFRPNISLYLIMNRIGLFVFLPLFITMTAFDRTRSARNGYEFRQKFKLPISKFILTVTVLFIIFIVLNYVCSAPYVLIGSSDRDNFKTLLAYPILPFFMPLIWFFLLSLLDEAISRPRVSARNTKRYRQ